MLLMLATFEWKTKGHHKIYARNTKTQKISVTSFPEMACTHPLNFVCVI